MNIVLEEDMQRKEGMAIHAVAMAAAAVLANSPEGRKDRLRREEAEEVASVFPIVFQRFSPLFSIRRRFPCVAHLPEPIFQGFAYEWVSVVVVSLQACKL